MLNQHKLAELEKIREADGGLLFPESIVQKATDPRNPLHDEFPWDDAQAAHQYRLDIARRLIRSVTVVRIEEERTIQTVYYVHHPSQGTHSQGYVALTELKRSKADARECLDFELSRIHGAISRAQGIAGVLGLDHYFEQMLKQLAQIRSKIKAA